MDNVDKNIVRILQKDGRISMQQLGKLLPMSVPATCERVHKLEDANIIKGYSAQLSPENMGKTIRVFILFSCNIGGLDEFLQQIKQEPRIVSASTLAGKFAVLLEACCRDMKDYADLIKTIYPYGTSESYIQVEEVKPLFYDFED